MTPEKTTAEPRYQRNPLTAGRVVDGVAFVVTPENNKLHSLNAAATLLWEKAANGVTAREAAHALVSEFEVELAIAEQDASVCLRDLAQRDILVCR